MEWNRQIIDGISFRKYKKWDVLVYEDDIKSEGTMLIEADLCRGVLDFAGTATMFPGDRIVPDKVVENDWIKCFGWFSWSVEPMFYEYWKEFLPPTGEVSFFDAQRVWDDFVKSIKSMQNGDPGLR